MANTFTKFDKGLVLIPSTAPTSVENGELQYRSSDDRILATYAGVSGQVVIDNASQTLTNKALSGAGNTSISGTLVATGGVTANTLSVTGLISARGALAVTGGMTVTGGGVTFYNDADVTFLAGVTASTGMYVDGAALIAASGISSSGDITALGLVSASALTTTGTLTAASGQINGGMTVTGALAASTLALQGAADLTAIATPSTPAASHYKIYPKSDGKLRILDSAGNEKLVGSPQGSGTLRWVVDVDSPLYQQEMQNDVYLYQSGSGTQHLYAYFKVPTEYVSGSQIRLKMPMYAPATAGTILLKTVASLVRPGVDAVSSVTNQRTSTNSSTTLASGSANVPVYNTFDLTDTSGQINAVAVSADYMIRVDLMRGSDTCADDLRAVVYSTEILFG